jgi:RNA polymerase sigma-70 factor (ECF subfamily)
MPAPPFEWLGPALAGRFFQAMWTALGTPPRLVATRANGQPAFALYALDPHAGGRYALGLRVLTLAGDRVRVIMRFEASVPARFGLDQSPAD